MTLYEFVHPLTMARHPSILLPTCAYAMIFLFGNILATVEVPSLLQLKFGLNAEQLGLQFLGVIIGSVIGEQMGGRMSDFWMSRRSMRLNRKAEPEFRLWLSYFGFALTIIGVIVFLVCTQFSTPGHWSVSPIIGTGIGAVGNQLVTTVMMTYAIDCFPHEAGSIGVFVTLVRQVWGFIGPFWYVSCPHILNRIVANQVLQVHSYVRNCWNRPECRHCGGPDRLLQCNSHSLHPMAGSDMASATQRVKDRVVGSLSWRI